MSANADVQAAARAAGDEVAAVLYRHLGGTADPATAWAIAMVVAGRMVGAAVGAAEASGVIGHHQPGEAVDMLLDFLFPEAEAALTAVRRGGGHG